MDLVLDEVPEAQDSDQKAAVLESAPGVVLAPALEALELEPVSVAADGCQENAAQVFETKAGLRFWRVNPFAKNRSVFADHQSVLTLRSLVLQALEFLALAAVTIAAQAPE